jgi:hypothetical protein
VRRSFGGRVVEARHHGARVALIERDAHENLSSKLLLESLLERFGEQRGDVEQDRAV